MILITYFKFNLNYILINFGLNINLNNYYKLFLNIIIVLKPYVLYINNLKYLIKSKYLRL
jgi:hypothetical protein